RKLVRSSIGSFPMAVVWASSRKRSIQIITLPLGIIHKLLLILHLSIALIICARPKSAWLSIIQIQLLLLSVYRNSNEQPANETDRVIIRSVFVRLILNQYTHHFELLYNHEIIAQSYS